MIMYRGNSLEKLFKPRNVAIYGDTSAHGKIFKRCLLFLQASAFTGNIYPVTEEYSEINGLKCFRDISSLPDAPDVILIDSTPSHIPDIVRQAGAKGIPYGIIFSPGQDGLIKEKISAELRGSGIRILGPNSQGLLNISCGIPLTYSISLPLLPEPGSHVALVSQSSSLGFACFTSAREKGVKFSYLVTTGDQVDIDDLEVAGVLLGDKEIDLIILYLEDITDGKRLLSFFRRAREKDVTVAVLKAACYGTSAFSSKYQFSGFIDEEQIWEAALRQHGVIRLRDVDEISDLAALFSLRHPPRGPRVGVISSSRGAGILMADHCRSHHLEIPELSLATQQKLKELLPSHGYHNNPVNLTSMILEEPDLFRATLEILLDEEELDVVIPVVTTSSIDLAETVAKNIMSSYQAMEKSLICCWISKGNDLDPSISLLKESDIPVFDNFEACAAALSQMVQWSCSCPYEDKSQMPSFRKVNEELKTEFTEYDAKKLLNSYGINVTREELCNNLSEAIEAAETIGYPVALKVMSPDILRKTQARVIALNLKDSEEVRNAYGRTLERAAKSNPEARISGVVVQEMLNQGLECMICARRHPVFGPVVSVGLGGIYVEFLNDRSTKLAPVSMNSAMDMIRILNGYPLIKGVWGSQSYHVESLASMVSLVSNIIHVEEDIQEINIDPVFVRITDSVVVDAFIIRR